MTLQDVLSALGTDARCEGKLLGERLVLGPDDDGVLIGRFAAQAFKEVANFETWHKGYATSNASFPFLLRSGTKTSALPLTS